MTMGEENIIDPQEVEEELIEDEPTLADEYEAMVDELEGQAYPDPEPGSADVDIAE